MDPDHWNNRRVTWEFIEAPNYSGDIEIGFVQGSERWWAGVSINHLPNGIHGVEHFADGQWVPTPMNVDMGQSFLLEPITAGGTDYRIRVKDVDDEYLFGGREYAFSLPESCGGKCTAPRTVVTYTTTEGDGSTPVPTATATPTATAGPTATPTTAPDGGTDVCTATFRTTSAWPGGYQGEVTVTAGAAALTSWHVTLPGASVGALWNGVATTSGAEVTVGNAPYNGTLAPGGSTTFGFVGIGTPDLAELSCWA